MLAAVVFYSILFTALVILPALLILVFLLFLDHERKFWRRVAPTIGPTARRIWDHPRVQSLRQRYPRLIAFITRRFDPHDPWGLPATIATLGVLIGLWFFLGVLQDIIGKDPLVTLDVRLHNSVALVRTPGMTWFMLVLTELGSPAFLWAVCVGTALIALSRGNRRLAATFLAAIAGTGLLSVVLKAAVGQARPADALIAAREASFPSGHMLSSAVVYGLFASLLLGSNLRRSARALGTVLLLLLVVGIGLSRLYLGVHWPSDLLGSLAVALACLPLLLFFLHYGRPIPRIDDARIPVSPATLRVLGIAVLVASTGIGALLMRHTRIVAIRPPAPAVPIPLDAIVLGLPSDLPRRSEDLVGVPMEPISIVFVGSADQVIRTFTQAGWTRADPPTPVRLVKEGLSALTNRSDASGPATPAYLADRPPTLTFEKPDAASPGIRRRHHTRAWQTRYCAMPGCRPIWVATASFDVGIELSPRSHLPTHRIDPHVDRERALIVQDLSAARATEIGNIRVVPPLTGTNAAGDAFTTDGRATILAMPAT